MRFEFKDLRSSFHKIRGKLAPIISILEGAGRRKTLHDQRLTTETDELKTREEISYDVALASLKCDVGQNCLSGWGV